MQKALFQLPLFEKKDKKPPPHELALIVDEIIKVVGEDPKYNYRYWLRRAKGWRYGDIMAILKDIQKMDKKYPKGATLTNKLLRKC